VKVTLLFPPHWAAFQPYVSLPVLTAALRREGYTVIQRDINIEWFDRLMSTGGLKKSYEKIQSRLEALSASVERDEKEELEFKHLSAWKTAGPDIIRLVKGAKDLMKDGKRFFDFNSYRNGNLVLYKAYQMLGDCYFPTILDFYSFEHKYSRSSTASIIEAVNDREGNMYLDYFEKVTIPSLKENPSDFYGISISAFSQTIAGITLAAMIKKAFPEAHICIGGNVFTRVGPRLLPSSPLFDYFDSVVLYEGEVSLLKLLEALKGKRDFCEVPAIIYRDKKGELIYNEKVENPVINELPPPDFSGLPLDKYLSPFPVFPILSARGCYWGKCAFCQHKYTYRGGYRPRKIESVADDIEFIIKKSGARFFSFNDEAIPPLRLKKIALEILERKLDIFWEAYARVDESFTEDIAGILYKSGCRKLSFGLESSSPRVLELMRKGIDIKTFEKVLRISSGAGIWNYVWFFTGFPSETEEEARATVDFILKNSDKIHSVSLGAVFGLEEYTDIVENPDKYFLKEVITLENTDLSFIYDYTVSRGLSPEEARELAKELNVKILDEHPQGVIMAIMARVHQFLYASHYAGNNLASFIK